MQLTSAVAVLITLCVTFILFARLFPWDMALERRSGQPLAPDLELSVVELPARPATESLDQMEHTIREMEILLDRIDDVHHDSHTRKWSRIPESHLKLFAEAYQHRPEPEL